MRTKFYLAALCLPLAFAACTSEDLMTEGVQMPQRQQIDVTLTAEKPAIGVDSRLGIDGQNNFLWEKDADMIGAALTDGASAGTPANNILVNYPFTADNSAKSSTFSGKSSVTEGIYFFYYGYQDVLNRGELNLNVPDQVYDVDAEKSTKEQAVSYMKMISPLVNLASGVTYADAQSYNIPLEFVNLYTLVRVQIGSENIPDGITPKVTKVKLNDSSNPFVKEATAEIATNIKAAGVSGYDGNGEWEASAYATNKANLAAKVNDGTIYDDVTTGDAVVTIDGDLPLSEANTTDVYLLVPKGDYQNLVLTVETSEGVYTRTITSASAIEFRDNIRALSASLNFAQDGSGNVVLPQSFDIESTADWNNAVKFMTDHSVGYLNKQVTFNLKKSIEIANLPIFNLTINGTAYSHVNLATGVEASVNPTLTLTSNYTISNENYNQFTVSNVKLGVAAGATLNVKKDGFTFAEIVNQGTLNISTTVSKPIVNLGTMNINDGSTIANLQNGRAASTSPVVAKIEGTMNIAAGKTATVTALDAEAGTISIPSSSKLIVTAGTNAAAINVNGELDGAFTNSGTIDNYGKLSAAIVNTDGTVKVQNNSVSDNAQTVDGGKVVIVDVTYFSELQASGDRSASHYVFNGATVTTVVTNGAEYNKANVCTAINDITLSNGTWKLKSAVATPSTANKDIVAPAVNINSITLDAATLDMVDATLAKSIYVNGVSALTASAAKIVTGDLTVAAGASLTVGNYVTMNAAASANTQVATINGALTVNPGAAMYFKTATVGRAGAVTVMGETSTTSEAIFGVSTSASFTNSGLVESKAATKNGGGDAGQVTRPDNQPTGTFKGNPTEITFS